MKKQVNSKIKNIILLSTVLEVVVVAVSLSVFWGWFVVPLGAPNVGFIHAIGFMAIWQLFKPSPGSKGIDGIQTLEKNTNSFIDEFVKAFSSSLVRFFMAWTFALIAHFTS